MNRKTRKALLESIFIKWENILSCKGDDAGIEDCALCKLFFRNGCICCPVKGKSKLPECENTPYSKWHRTAPRHNGYKSWLGTHPNIKVINAAVKEQEFLISLLPQKNIENLEVMHKDFMSKLKEEN